MSRVAARTPSARQRVLLARRRALHDGFLRAAAVQRRLGLEHRDSEMAAEHVVDGRVCWVRGRRMTTGRALREVARVVSGTACCAAILRGCPARDACALQAVVRAHILGTSLTLSTITRVFQFGGWIAQSALEMLPRTR
jgi:hypothetical protein